MAIEIEVDSDRGKDDPAALLRRCIVTGEMLPKAALVRFVVAPNRVVVPDIACKLPGKGLWVKGEKQIIQAAIQKKLFGKVAKRQVIVEEQLLEKVGQALKGGCLSLLSMAKKSGMLVNGYMKVSQLEQAGKAALILRAKDSAFAGHGKVGESRTVPEILLFNNEELSIALGCENVVHAALKEGGIANKCRIEIERYRQYIHDIE